MSNMYCVDCGERNIPEDQAWKRYRCLPCWKRFKANGGIVTEKTPIVKRGGITTGGYPIWKNYARFCRLCGNPVGTAESNQRVKYALLRGGECMKCDDCHYENHPRSILRSARKLPPRHEQL